MNVLHLAQLLSTFHELWTIPYTLENHPDLFQAYRDFWTVAAGLNRSLDVAQDLDIIIWNLTHVHP